LGGVLLGWRTVCAVELDPFCRAVLLARQRDGLLERFPVWDDVCTFDGVPWRGHVDVISGGFPCQDISCSGHKAGIGGARSGLWSEFARIIGEVRPAFAFVENSADLVSRGLEVVLGDLAALGYAARWDVLGARHVGAPHRRERLWLVAYAPGEHGIARVGGMQPLQSQPAQPSGVRDGPARGGNPWSIPLGPYHRVVDGVARRVDRVRAAANGQVPAVARLAWVNLARSASGH